MQNSTTIDKAEIQKFQAMADEWWDPNGKFKPLHMLNPCRLQYIVEQITIHFRRNCQEDCRLGLPEHGMVPAVDAQGH